MLLYLACWLVLVPVAYLVGIALPVTRTVSRLGDRTVVAVWTGLMLIGAGLLGLSLLLPLGSSVAAILVAAAALGALGSAAVRAEIRTLRDGAMPRWVVTAGLLLAVAALIAGQHGPTGDVGLYHYQLMVGVHLVVVLSRLLTGRTSRCSNGESGTWCTSSRRSVAAAGRRRFPARPISPAPTCGSGLRGGFMIGGGEADGP